MSERWWGSRGDVAGEETCRKEALKAGATSAAWTGALSAALVLGAANFFPQFQRKLTVSSKTALIIMPPFFMFALKSELAMNECKRQRTMRKRVGVLHSST